MKRKMINTIVLSCLSIMLFGCASKEERIDVTFELSNDIKVNVTQVAKDYLIKNNCGTSETIQVGTASITDYLVGASDEVSDPKDIGQVVYKVTFKDKSHVDTYLPEVLVNQDNNRVVGFIVGN
ncbi:hypothetical protein [Viridibacillus arvi]|uniref:DUF3221 domain-containing protein n=1 Tax=Viridibacillus arvi TaxID=263475 RepID=A0A0M0LLI0_9BACL|nr:hypothetical protein [Viridibacillus arvi]KOO51553.1 hypothetical protein AMD00_03545 [Viridibacillus arvi]